MSRKKALGRGLDALLGVGRDEPTLGAEAANGDRLLNIPIDLIQRGRYQPRLDLKPEALQELAASIRAQGVVQPVVVRALPDSSRYELVAGERRWRAAQLAGLHELPALVKTLSDKAVMSIALIENIQREQLNPIEEALALQRLINEFEMTHQEVADAIGRSRAAVTNLLRLLDLGVQARALLAAGALEMGHARALLGLAAPAQGLLAARVASEGLSVRATENLVRALAKPAPTSPPVPRADPNVAELETSLAERLGAAVSIRPGRAGRGTLVIHYGSLDELDGILAHIQ
ncbi:MAG: ParB/RepB/Spo0J family partition protein [Gammaproteobacteria bacterium]|nr:ParB/RepB/Spo0J family partition protein [Gammaproteobacteria bacterium]